LVGDPNGGPIEGTLVGRRSKPRSVKGSARKRRPLRSKK
jgi:hypothetical protein